MTKKEKQAMLDKYKYSEGEILLNEIIVDDVEPDVGFLKSHEHLGHASQVILNKKTTLEKGKRYSVIDGRKTINALLKLGKEKVRARIYENMPREIARYILLVKNIQAAPSSLVEAEAVKKLMDEDHKTLKEIAEITGVHPSMLSKKLSLLDLPKSIQEQLRRNVLTDSLAYRIHGLPKDVQLKISKEKEIIGDVVEKYHREHLNSQLSFKDIELPEQEKEAPQIKHYALTLAGKQKKVTRKELMSDVDEIIAGLKKDQELVIKRL